MAHDPFWFWNVGQWLYCWNCLSILNCDGGESHTTCYAMVEALILLAMQ